MIVLTFPGETPHGETVLPDRSGRGRGADGVGVYRGPDIQFSSTVMSIFSRAVSRTRSSWLTWPTSPWSLSTGSKVRTASESGVRRTYSSQYDQSAPVSGYKLRSYVVKTSFNLLTQS